MSIRHTACSDNLGKNLEELKRRRDLESLRPYLIQESCFPAHKVPETCNISVEDLKKLGRIWKIQERRALMKSNAELTDIVNALLQHINNNKKYSPDSNPTSSSPFQFSIAPAGGQIKSSVSPRQMKNFCGLKELFREGNPIEIAYGSRVSNFPSSGNPLVPTVDQWRKEDMQLPSAEFAEEIFKLQAGNASGKASKSDTDDIENGGGGNSTNAGGKSAKFGSNPHPLMYGKGHNKGVLSKHRQLAAHLVNFSSQHDLTNHFFVLKNVQTFMAVADTDDTKIGAFCMLALSNVCSFPSARQFLVEMNAINRLSNLQNISRAPKVVWASALLFYYFSLDSEIEDRIYSACNLALQSNAAAWELPQLSLVAVQTLNNLLPSIDRPRIVELIIGHYVSVLNMPELDAPLILEYLNIIQNICNFPNSHINLLQLELLEIMMKYTEFAIENNDTDIGLLVGKTLLCLLSNLDNVANIISIDFVNVLIEVCKLKSTNVYRPAFRALAIISSTKQLINLVCDSEVISPITAIVEQTKNLPNDIAKDAARFLANVSQPTSREYINRLIMDGVSVAILTLIMNHKSDPSIQAIAVKGLQNILSSREAKDISEICIDPLMLMMEQQHDLGAIHSMYNIAVLNEGVDLFSETKVHTRVLDYMCNSETLLAKSAYIRFLIQVISDSKYVNDLLLHGKLISKLEKLLDESTSNIAKGKEGVDWFDLSNLLLAVATFKQDLNEKDRYGITKILKVITSNTDDDRVIGTSATIIAFLSLFLEDFNEVDFVLRSILEQPLSDVSKEAVSTVFYNLSCSEDHLHMLYNDGYYINIMVKLMRSGIISVQNNVSLTMRNMCSRPKCIVTMMTTRTVEGQKSDSLSDLIVIALLRSSSIDIKEVCTETFFNMLCHEATRLKLLQGEVWWTIAKLSKTEDTNRISEIIVNLLYDLSCDSTLIQSMRDHHVLTFIKDFIQGKSEDLLQKTLKSVLNFVSSIGTVVTYESVALIRIFCIIIPHCQTAESVLQILPLLLLCVQQNKDESDVEFVNLDIVRILDECKHVWSSSTDCKRLVSGILLDISESTHFTKSVLMSDLMSLWTVIYRYSQDVDIALHMLTVMYRYMARGLLPSELMVTTELFQWLLCDVFGVSRLDFKSNGNPHSFTARSFAVAILAFIMPETLNYPTFVPATVAHNIICNELVTNPQSKENTLIFVYYMTLDLKLASILLQPGSHIFHVMTHYMDYEQKSKLKSSSIFPAKKDDVIHEYMSTLVLNISMHRTLVFDLIAPRDNGLDILVSRVMDTTQNDVVLHDLSSFYFFCSVFMLKHEFTISPSLTLAQMNIMNKKTTDLEVITIGKYVIGIVLEKYSTGLNIDPVFVQSMLVEIQVNSSAGIPSMMASRSHKLLTMANSIDVDILKVVPNVVVKLSTFPPDPARWNPITSRVRKRMSNVLTKLGVNDPEIFTKLAPGDIPACPPYRKIQNAFDKITLAKEGLEEILAIEDPIPDEELDVNDEESKQSNSTGASSHRKPKHHKGTKDAGHHKDAAIKEEKSEI